MDDYSDVFDDRGQIRLERVDDLLVEVVSGKYIYALTNKPNVLLASRNPTAKEQDDGRVVFTKALRLAQARGLLLKADLDRLALERDLYTPGERDEKVSLLTHMERQQKAKEKTKDERQKSLLTTEIEMARKRIIQIEMNEFKLLQHAAEFRAEEARANFYVANCTLTGDMLDVPLWGSFAEYLACADWPLLQDVRRAFGRVNAGLPVKVIRAVARCNEWRLRWKSYRESGTPPFDGTAPNWDKNKVSLIYWSDFYDNIYQHPECPGDDVVGDDDLLQDWLNAQVAKRKSTQQQVPTAGGRQTPHYIDGAGRRKPMTKLGGDQTINVGTPYKVRV